MFALRIEGLILDAGADICLGQRGEKLFELLLTRQVRREQGDMLALASQPGTIALLGFERPNACVALRTKIGHAPECG